MIKATEDFPVYIKGELLHLKEGDEVICDEALGKHLIDSGRCERVVETPKQEIKVEAVQEKKIEKEVEAKVEEKPASKRSYKKAKK